MDDIVDLFVNLEGGKGLVIPGMKRHVAQSWIDFWPGQKEMTLKFRKQEEGKGPVQSVLMTPDGKMYSPPFDITQVVGMEIKERNK